MRAIVLEFCLLSQMKSTLADKGDTATRTSGFFFLVWKRMGRIRRNPGVSDNKEITLDPEKYDKKQDGEQQGNVVQAEVNAIKYTRMIKETPPHLLSK